VQVYEAVLSRFFAIGEGEGGEGGY